METRHPVEGSFGSEFPAIYNHCVLMARVLHGYGNGKIPRDYRGNSNQI